MQNNEIKILVVDDQPSNLRFLSNSLMEQGYKVQRAISGRLALNAAIASPPDLIVLDVLMPEMNGYEVCKHLKANSKTQGIPVIFFSALNEATEKVKAFRVGGVDYITKPFEVKEILARIENQLTIQKLQKQLKAQNALLQQEIAIRKQAQEAVRRQLVAVESAMDGIALLNSQSEFIYLNEAHVKLFGYSSNKELLGKTWHELYDPEEIYRFERDVFPPLLAAGQWRGEAIARKKDGTTFFEEVSLTLTEDGGMICVCRDISDRKQAELALRESEERFRTMADSTAVLLWVSDTNAQCTFFNKTWLEFTGRSLKDQLGDNWFSNVHPDDQQYSVSTYIKTFEAHKSFEMEYRLRRFDGEYRWIVDSGKPRFTADGSFAGYINACLDITERKQAEIEITAAKAALEQQIQRVLLLERISQEIRSSLKPEQIFPTAATQVGKVFRVNRCLIHTYIDHPTPRIPFVAEYKEPDRESIASMEIPVLGNPHAELILRQDSCIASDNVYTEPMLEAVSPICQQLGLKSMLCVRTSYQGKPNGVIGIHQYDRFRHWTDDEIELLEAVAAQMGIAIAQANLLEQEKQRRQELDWQNYQLQTEIKVRQQTEAALEDSQRFIQGIVDANPNILYVYDLVEQCSIYTNREVSRLLGYTPQEVKDMGAALMPTLLPPDDLAAFREHLKKFNTAKDGEIIEIEYRIRRKDGELRWFYSWDTLFTRDSEGKPKQIIGTVSDITDRKLAEDALGRQAEMDRLVGKISRQFIDQNLDTAINFALQKIGQNARCDRIYIIHYPNRLSQVNMTHEWCAQGIAALSHDFQQLSDIHSWVHTQLINGNTVQINNVADLPSDAVTPKAELEHQSIQSMLHVPIIHSSKLVGCIGMDAVRSTKKWTQEDIKLLKLVGEIIAISQSRHQAEAALQEALHTAEAASCAKSEFLSKMTHELRTPLNAILGFSQVMARNDSLTQEQREYLGIINRSGEHLLALINDILSMSKIEAGQVTLNETCVDLYQTLCSIEQMLQLKASSKGIELIFECAPDLPQYVQTDESKLRQVLINLLGNAIKFTQEGRVTLRVKWEEGTGDKGQGRNFTEISAQTSCPTPIPNPQCLITFEVEDTGPGIAPTELDTLFNPFVQTQTGRQSMKGTGLGLAISQQFVKLMGSEITVSSILDQGTIFTFDIQLRLASAADCQIITNRRVVGLEPNQPKYRILVVEDIVENRQLLVTLLKPLAFEVREAANGQEGVALWQSWQPHLILMDIFMPIMDGYKATQLIKQTLQGQNTVIIALTASVFEEQQTAILVSGCDDFIRKPFREEVLLQKITHHLGVRYVYEEDLPATLPHQKSAQPLGLTVDGTAYIGTDNSMLFDPAGRSLKATLRSSDLEVMPKEWVARLHQAALSLDDQTIIELIKQIPNDQETLANALRDLVDNFSLDIIIDLTCT